MSNKNCKIVLDNPWNTYYAGQIINGQVDIVLAEPELINSITIEFLGETKTKLQHFIGENFVNTHSLGNSGTKTFIGHERYFEEKSYLFGESNSTGSEIELSGTLSYPFTYELPAKLPTSFEGLYGSIRYVIIVMIERPAQKMYDSMVKAFTVISPVDLNRNSSLNEKTHLEMEKTFCCFCCNSEPLTLLSTIPVTGYISGQIIPIIVEYDNGSSIELNYISLKLQQVIKYWATWPRRAEKMVINDITETRIENIGTYSADTCIKHLLIPPLPPSNLDNCGIIELRYQLFVQVNTSRLHWDLQGTIDLTIGTIPLTKFKSPLPDHEAKEQFLKLPLDELNASIVRSTSKGDCGGAFSWHADHKTLSDESHPHSKLALPIFPEGIFRNNLSQFYTGDNGKAQIIDGESFAPRYPSHALGFNLLLGI